MPVGLLVVSGCEGSKSPNTVKAAVRPVSLMASRLSVARPPPVAGTSEVNLKFVGVELARLATHGIRRSIREYWISGLIARGLHALGRIQVAAQAERLVVDRPQAFFCRVWRCEERQSFEDRLTLAECGIGE